VLNAPGVGVPPPHRQSFRARDRSQEVPMSFAVDAFALLPAVAAVIVVLAALWDERDNDAIDRMRSLDGELQ
jgi:hypothetical protein